MINSKKLQNLYNHLYSCLREYIWPAKVIESIANLEISVYKSFVDISEVRKNFNDVKINCLKYIREDEDLNKEFDKFEELMEEFDDNNNVYAKLNSRVEGDIKQ